MRRSLWAAVVLGLAAATAPAGSPAPAAPAGATVDLVGCIPEETLFALRARPGPLMASDLWKAAAASKVIDREKAVRESPLAIDAEKDVADGVFALAMQFKDGRPRESSWGALLAMTRDVEAAALFKKRAKTATAPGFDRQAYVHGPGTFLAVLAPRLVLIGTPDYLARMAAAAEGGKAGPAQTFWRQALDRPGELLAAARAPEGLRQVLQKARDDLLANSGRSRMSQLEIGRLVGTDFLIRLGLEFRSAVAVLDLSRPAEPLRASIEFASEDGAAFIGSGLNLLEPSIDLALEYAPGRPALGSVREAALYRATYAGKETLITVTRTALDRLFRAANPDQTRKQP